jgi:hypothetical protein
VSYQQKDGDGALFKNEDKEVAQHADYKGSITIGGQDYWLNAWINTAKESGKKYMRVSAQLKKPKTSAPSRELIDGGDLGVVEVELNDEIPFN